MAVEHAHATQVTPHHDLPGQPPTLDVLLVEDDDGDALIVDELLHQAGASIEVTRVRTLGQALQHVGSKACILLDLGLPDTTDLSGIYTLRQAAPEAALLVLTGLDDQHKGEQAVTAGAQDYLVKGQVDSHLLDRAIRYAVQRQRADDQDRQLLESSLQASENSRLERGLLPKPLLNDPRVQVISRYRPGSRRSLLGGDFLDVVQDHNGAVHLLIGDVAGHGPDEAALGVCLRIAWRTLVLAGYDPDRLLAAVEEVLLHERHNEEDFATVCTVTIDSARRHAQLRLAGHPAPLLLGPPTRSLPEGDIRGPALGITDNAQWPALEVSLGESDPGGGVQQPWNLLLFTDGLVEGRGRVAGTRLGVEGLIALLDHMPPPTSRTGFVDDLIDQVRHLNGQEMSDDLAAVVVSFTPESSG